MDINTLRQTGRTTRLLDAAVKLAEQGKAVYVVAATMQHAKQLEATGGEKAAKLGIKFEAAGMLSNLDWNTLTLHGAHPNCKILVDHYAIESRFHCVLGMLHRFDT